MQKSKHIWNFSTVGGVKRVNLESGSDLIHLNELDPKLWTALSCPVNDLEIDKNTLLLIDSDNDGQIRVPEVLDAVNWMVSVLKDPADLLKQSPVFPLSAINDSTEQGKILLDSARVILKNLGKENADSLTSEETSDNGKIFAATAFNGDGIITEDTTGSDAELTTLLNEITQHTTSATDRNGKQGISAEILDTFFDQCTQFAAWHAKAEASPETIMPLGTDTEVAYANYIAIKSKVDDFFIRCRLAAFDPQSTEVLNLQVARVQNITEKDLSDCLSEIATYPIARIQANAQLPVTTGINPAWEGLMSTFRTLTIGRLLPGKTSITEAEWNNISASFTAYAAWMAEKEGAMAAPLGLYRTRQILDGPYKEQLARLIEKDKALEQESNNILLVNTLVRYYRDLFTLLKNFVTFYDFYTPGTKAIFQAGTLYIDQRSCDLCVRVHDSAKHAILASYSGMYLIYCECVSKTSPEKMTIVAALTNGDIDNLVVGWNALFYDRHGNDWDATIVKIIDNPISIRQAFFSPYRKVSQFVEKQIDKMAASENDKVSANLSKGVEALPAAATDDKAKKEPPTPFDVGKFVGIFAAIGLALGAIGTALASVLGGFIKLTWWKMPLAIAGILLLISGPSMIIAYLKLRKRNLAPLLDANGWAINARVVVNIQFGRALTQLAELPKGARISVNDPFMKKKTPILPFLLLTMAVAAALCYVLWKNGMIHIHF